MEWMRPAVNTPPGRMPLLRGRAMTEEDVRRLDEYASGVKSRREARRRRKEEWVKLKFGRKVEVRDG